MIYKNFIFDFGGVLYDINPESTFEALIALSDKKETVKSKDFIETQSLSGFLDFERGLISENEFRQFIRTEFFINKTDVEIDNAWNKTLVGLRPEAMAMIKQFKNEGNIYLLSNTNSIHFRYFYTQCAKLFKLFNELFFSFELGLRKPEPEIFEYVIEKYHLNHAETIFFDDVITNIEAANSCTLSTFHITSSVSLSDLFHSVINGTQQYKY